MTKADIQEILESWTRFEESGYEIIGQVGAPSTILVIC